MAWLRYRWAVIAAGGLLFVLAALSVVLAIDWTEVNGETTWADAIAWSEEIGYMADLVTVVGISTMVVGLLQHFYQRLPETIVREAIRDLHDENPAKGVEARMKLLSHAEQSVQALHEYVTFLMETDAPNEMDVALGILLRIAYKGRGRWWSQAHRGAQGHLQGYLSSAAEGGHLALTKLLLDGGVEADTQDSIGSTPLHDAAFNNHHEVAQLLLEHGADVNAQDNNGNTPLHEAAEVGRLDVVELLLEHGADVNAQDIGGYTPLHWAASRGHREVAELLLERGADVNAPDNDGDTPLHVAAANGHLEVAELLLERGAEE